MALRKSFFSAVGMNQSVNQWLCILFLGLFCFWTVLYYVTQRAEALADSYVLQRSIE